MLVSKKIFHFVAWIIFALSAAVFSADVSRELSAREKVDLYLESVSDQDIVSASEKQIAINALTYFEAYFSGIEIEISSLLVLVRRIEQCKSFWLEYPSLDIAPSTLLFTTKQGKLDGHVVIKFQILSDRILLTTANNHIGKGTYSNYESRILYPSFTATAFGVPYDDGNLENFKNALSAFDNQLEVYSHLQEHGVDDLWQSNLKPIIVSNFWSLFPRLDFDLADAIIAQNSNQKKLQFQTENYVDAIGQVVHAIKSLHLSGVASNDVKPENIMIASSGNCYCAYLIDLNLASIPKKLLASGQMRPSVGSSYYMAPEVLCSTWCAGDLATKVTNAYKSDVYSAGITIYAALYHRLPSFVCEKNLQRDVHYKKLSENLAEYYKNFWAKQHHCRVSFLISACVRHYVNDRITSEELNRAWAYAGPLILKAKAVEARELTKEEVEGLTVLSDFEFWDVDDAGATAVLSKSMPGVFILRVDTSEDKLRIKVSFVLPMHEQKLADKIVQHMFIHRDVINEKKLKREIRFFKDLRLLNKEYLSPDFKDSGSGDEDETVGNDAAEY